MTANPELPPITCPSSLVASCAPLLGYEPSDCLVGFIRGVPDRLGAVLVRVDLGSPDHAQQQAASLTASILGTGGRVVDLVAWVDSGDDTPRDQLPSSALIEALADGLIEVGIEVGASLSTNGRVWWSHECPDALCCGASDSLDHSVMTRVRAEYVFAGFAPLPSRAVIGERIERDELRAAAVARCLLAARPPGQVERWRDSQVEFLSRLLVPSPGSSVPSRSGTLSGVDRGRAPAPAAGLAAPQAARMLRGLADIRVRDTLLLRLILAPDSDRSAWDLTIARLCDVLRAAPAGRGAPPATLLALVSWMSGDGVLANLALDRSEEEDPSYRLAALAREVMVRGMDPRIWRASMAGLTEAECRSPGRSCGPGSDGEDG